MLRYQTRTFQTQSISGYEMCLCQMHLTIHLGGDNPVLLLINWIIIAICCFWVSEKVSIKLLKFSPHYLKVSTLSPNSLFSSSSSSSTAAPFLFLTCLDCFFLSVLILCAYFFFGSPCQTGYLNHPNKLGSRHCCCVMC